LTLANGGGILICQAGPDDAPALARLRYQFRTELHHPAEDEAAFLNRCRRWMTDQLAPNGSWRCWLAGEASAPVGSSWLQLLDKIPNPVGEPELHGYISSLYVIPAHRGSGIGSALLTECLRECEARGADAVFLWPTPRSRSLYQRHGFAVREDLLQRRMGRGAPA
jgi:ribosomal protein S18 acetylase RimI-like enzyme